MEEFFTSESVSEGHPDKLADQISDAVLDAFLREDPRSRLACETFLTGSLIAVAGEAKSRRPLSPAAIKGIAQSVIERAGYDSEEKGFAPSQILAELSPQSLDIQNAVRSGKAQGAGDQGIMFGYAVDETSSAMPLSIHLAHKLMKNLSLLRRKKGNEFLFPDGKSQVTVRYERGKAKDVAAIVISAQHSSGCKLKFLREFIREELIERCAPKRLLGRGLQIMINPGGPFEKGGPSADCGLTGRKIIADTYGGHGAHGGGAFSGKDPSKVDRCAAYAARHIAKNLVLSGLAQKCLIQISYAIGKSHPVSLWVEDFNTSPLSKERLRDIILQHWDLTPYGIIKQLDLLRPIYLQTAAYGHFGREDFSWEKADKADALRAFLPPSPSSPKAARNRPAAPAPLLEPV